MQKIMKSVTGGGDQGDQNEETDRDDQNSQSRPVFFGENLASGPVSAVRAGVGSNGDSFWS